MFRRCQPKHRTSREKSLKNGWVDQCRSEEVGEVEESVSEAGKHGDECEPEEITH